MNTFQDYPILEYDSCSTAIVNPKLKQPDQPVPVFAVACFFNNLLHRLAAEGRLREVYVLGSEIGKHPVYELEEDGWKCLVFHPGVGAPLSAGLLDEMIALGMRGVIACGGCGVLQKDIAAGHVVVLSAAVRDEGTSYHYLPPAREVLASEQATAALEDACQEQQIPYLKGKTWTTDGLYRETAARRALRVQEGCLVVEMEAAAFFAVAQFRGVHFGQVVYGGDLVVPEGWDLREWHKRLDDRERLFWLAVRACAFLQARLETKPGK
ncbi:MAG TPA: nucleoside phosphorylase [Anaerolineaceae bacterium]